MGVSMLFRLAARCGFLIAVCVGISTPAKAQSMPSVDPAAVPGNVFDGWLGYARTRTFDGGFGGFVYALNQTSLHADGWVLRGEFSVGQYDPSVTTHGAALMFGYRRVVGSGLFTLLAGTAYESHVNTPAGAEITGTDGGGKFGVEYQIPRTGNFEFYSIGTYSTINDTYFAFVRPSFYLNENFRFGPEAMYYQNSAYSDYKVGGFVGFKEQGRELLISGGYLRPLTSGVRDGYYANVTVSIAR
jgi:hypothetical protein